MEINQSKVLGQVQCEKPGERGITKKKKSMEGLQDKRDMEFQDEESMCTKYLIPNNS